MPKLPSDPQQKLRFHIVLILCVSAFCLFCLALSLATPQVPFELATQNSGNALGLVVKRSAADSALRAGDQIEAVNGQSVSSSAAFYFAILNAKQAEIEIKRSGTRIVRPLSAEDFQDDKLPAGLRESDQALMISGADGNYMPLNEIDWAGLRALLSEPSASGTRSVVFRRAEERLHVLLELSPAYLRHSLSALTFLLILLMMFVAIHDNKENRPETRQKAWQSNISLALACASTLFLGLSSILLSLPPVYIVGLVAMTLFKASDLDFHWQALWQGRKTAKLARLLIYIAPIASLILPLFYALQVLPMLWGEQGKPEAELRLDTFSLVPLLWTLLYTLLDAARLIYQRINTAPHKAPKLGAHDLACALSAILAVIAFLQLRSDANLVVMLSIAIVILQALANAIDCLIDSKRLAILRFSDEIFSPESLRKTLAALEDIVGPQYLVQVVVERPEPKHIVGISLNHDDDSPDGLDLNALSPAWRDFLELFRLEGNTALVLEAWPSTQKTQDNPIMGIAQKLGIIIALPVAEEVAGSLSSLTLLISLAEDAPDKGDLALPLMHQLNAIQERLPELQNAALALVYLSAEMSLDYLGSDIDALILASQSTQPFLHALRYPTLGMMPMQTMPSQALPHGLLDEDEDKSEASKASPDSAETKETELQELRPSQLYDADVTLLRSQVQILHSQQVREYAVAEIELTDAQAQCLKILLKTQRPCLLFGEAGTGKHLLALSAHTQRSEQPLLCIDAALVPESIFALDVFGDETNLGMLQSAQGGGLYVENVDSLPPELLELLLQRADNAEQSLQLYLSVTLDKLHSEAEQQQRKDIQAFCKKHRIEAIEVPALRKQKDLLDVAEFFMHKQAMRYHKELIGFSPSASEALYHHPWPANFDELQNTIERAVLRAEGPELSPQELGKDFHPQEPNPKLLSNKEAERFREQIQLMQILNETQQGQIEELTRKLEALEAEREQTQA